MADLTPAKGIDVCRCICHDPHGPVSHIRPCCANWNGPLHGEVGRAQELIEARALREERARALRNCLVPGCLAQYDAVAALTGEQPARPEWSSEGWLTVRSAAPVFPAGAHICPKHSGLVKEHLPCRAPAEEGHLRAVCACGDWSSPPLRWHRAVRGLWEEHLLDALGADASPRRAEDPGALHDALHDAIERTIADNYADTTGGYLVAPWAVAALATRAAMTVLEAHTEEADTHG